MKKLIVYTPGNVGSKSISQALKDANVEHYYGHRIQHLLDTRPHVYDEIKDEKSRWKVLTLVRNPIDWAISLLARRLNQGNASNTDLNFDDYKHILTWFEENFETLFWVDVYTKASIIRNTGYQFYESDKAEVLVMKTEFLRESVSNELLSHFIGAKVTIPHINKWRSKHPAMIGYEPPQEFVNKMKNSRYWRYFYE